MSQHMASLQPGNPIEFVPLTCLEPLKTISAANSAKNSLAHLAHSHHSSADDIFDLEFASQNKYSAQENTSEEESEDQTVIENPNPICASDDPTENTKGQSDEYLDDAVYDPGNLGTIQEAEEYGYQSDSDTTMLIPHRGRMRKKLETDNKEVE